ncbi:ABC transporter permease [Puteibacter caeruleilacunae]|nr:ABC transporter permease [Puteibacter caeruleilacunae]
MIKHYLKSTINALWARKWISILTLISIALSLVVVICMASFWNMLTAPIKPEVNKDRTFYLHSEYFKKENGDKVHYFDAMGIIPKEFYTSTLSTLKSVELISNFQDGGMTTTFLKNGIGKSYNIKDTDSNFFKLFQFDFIDGKPYSEEMLSNKESVCVITEEVANHFFGTSKCAGEYISTGHRKFLVTGVIQQPSHITPVQSSVYFGKNQKDLLSNLTYSGLGTAFLCNSPNDQDILANQLKSIAKKLSAKNKNFDLTMKVKTSLDKIIAYRYQYRPMTKIRYVALILLILILPVLSLFELLKSGIAIRLEETGVRKAFGATNKVICRQLILENVLITIMGGILGIFIAIFFFKLIIGKQSSALFSDFFHWKAMIYYLLTFIVMGVLAGIIPSIKLARINLIDALHDKPQSLQLKSKLQHLFRGKIVTGTITVIAFFIVTITFNEVYFGLNNSQHTFVPLNTSGIINMKLSYKGDAYRWEINKESGKPSSNLKPIHNEVKHALQQIRGVKESSFSEEPLENQVGTYWDLDNNKEEGILCGFDYWKLFDLQLEEGRWFQSDDLKEVYLPVVITRAHATALEIEHLTTKTYFQFKSDRYDSKFRVVGIIKDIGKTHPRNRYPFFAPIDVSKDNSVSGDYRLVKIKDGEDIDRIKADIQSLFKSKGWDKKFHQYQIDTMDELMHQKIIEHLKYRSIEYGTIGMILCFILIILFGSSWRQVNAQYLELGIRRSVGASRARIIRKIIFEKLIFYLAVMVVAVLLYLNFYKDLKIDYKIIAPAVSAALLFVVIMLATLLPAIKASRIQPVDALAEE